MFDVRCQIIAHFENALNTLNAFMLASRGFEIEFSTQTIACHFRDAQHLRAVMEQELGNARSLGCVFLASYDLLARPETHVHLAVDTTRMIRRRRKIFLAAAELKQIKELMFELLG